MDFYKIVNTYFVVMAFLAVAKLASLKFVSVVVYWDAKFMLPPIGVGRAAVFLSVFKTD